MIGLHATPAMIITALMVAMIGAYVGLGVAERAKCQTGRAFYAWTIVAAASLGLGMSAMFLFSMGHRLVKTPLGLSIIGSSCVISVISLFCMFILLRRSDIIRWSIVPASILGGFALALIHFAVVIAIAQRLNIRYSIWYVLLTALFTVVCMGIALWMWRKSWDANSWLDHLWNSASKLWIGFTICGTFYVTRLGLSVDWQGPKHGGPHFLQNPSLTYLLGAAMVVLFGLIHFSTYMDRRFSIAQLTESEQRYKSLFEHNTAGVFTLDTEGRFMSLNAAAERICGYRSEELKGRLYYEYLCDEDVEPSLESFRRSMAGNVNVGTLDIFRKDGQRVTMEVQTVVMTVRGEIVGLYGIVRDISEQKRTEDLLRTSERLSVVGKLAAGLAHEIRNPLTGLKGFTQLLRNRAEGYTEYCDIMLSELDRIETIVSELLLLAKPQAVQYQRRDVRVILDRCVALMESQAILNNVIVRTNITAVLPNIWCEENQLKQVFINVLKNAMEAMPGGGTIDVVAAVSEDFLKIQVKDEGCGIPPDQIAKLGEPFFTTKEKGTGLGLMVCSRIIRNHHGELNIYSRLNEGTTIEILLPLKFPEHKETAS